MIHTCIKATTAIALAGSVLLLPTLTLNAERSDVDMYATMRQQATLALVSGPTPITHTRSNQIDPRLFARVTDAANRYGIPQHVMHYHVKRESSYQPTARNPRSTAKGLLQVLHGSHEAIIGERLSRQEHFRRMSDPDYALRVGSAHIRGCMQLMPRSSAHDLWKQCHYYGHANVGGSIRNAAIAYTQMNNGGGWLQLGSTAVPWSREQIGG